MTAILLTNAGLLALGATTLWAASVRLRDASIVDRFWGMLFVVVAWSTLVQTGSASPRALLLVGLTTLWGLRLSLYLTWRNWGGGEDYRYQAMRRHWGPRFWIISLATVFGLQAGLAWFISLPLQLAMPDSAPLGILDAIGLGLFLAGFAFEVIGDAQLTRFKADPTNEGRVMDRGLWRYTRHPNYFGDALLWWGLFLIAAASPLGRYALLSPIVMTFLLMRVSGVPMLERRLNRTRPEYADYIARTSAFLPRPPQPHA